MSLLGALLGILAFVCICYWVEHGFDVSPVAHVLRRLFRRCPPHLRGRVPVDCGVGTVTMRLWDDLGVVGPVATPDAVGRAFLRSVPPLGVKSITRENGGTVVRYEDSEDGRRAWRRSRLERYGPRLCDCTGAPHPQEVDCPVFHDEWWRSLNAVRMDMGFAAVSVPERPSPAENARRYTQEESTW